MRYQAWRSNTDKNIIVICGWDAFDALPQPIRALGPWLCTRDGKVANLQPAYRTLVERQGFVVTYQPLSQFRPDANREKP